MFPLDFNFPEIEYPSLYDDGESPVELLQSINDKMDNQDKIIENQKIQIAKQQQQIEFFKEKADSAKNESKKANMLSVVSLVVGAIGAITGIASLLFNIFNS